MNDPTLDPAVDLYRTLLDAWNRRHADDFAACFATQGVTIGFDGSPLDGRTAIATSLAAIFARHATPAYVARLREVRWLAPQTALLRAVVGMVPATASSSADAERAIQPALNALQSLVLTRLRTTWSIELLQNTPAAFHGRPDEAAALTDELSAVLRSGVLVDAGAAMPHLPITPATP